MFSTMLMLQTTEGGGMPPKKRKASLGGGQGPDAFRDESNDAAPIISHTPKRRKKLQYDPSELCQELFDTIRNHKDDNGRLLCESFIRVPKRRGEPEYYDLVTVPIDMLKIQHKLKNDEYEDLDQLSEDVELLVSNAKMFYARNSQEYQDACELMELFEETKSVLLAGLFGQDLPNQIGEVPNPNTPDLPACESVDESDITNPDADGMVADLFDEAQLAVANMKKDESAESLTADDSMSNKGDETTSSVADDDSCYEEFFSAVCLATDTDGQRNISDIFKLLPPRSKYPDYYEVIAEPMDLKTIATKIIQNAYTSLDEMYRDLFLMVSNAKVYNEPGSLVYKDAIAMKKAINLKKAELDQPRGPRAGRNRRKAGGQQQQQQPAPVKMTSILASMEYEESYCGEEEEVSEVIPIPTPSSAVVQQQQQQQPQQLPPQQQQQQQQPPPQPMASPILPTTVVQQAEHQEETMDPMEEEGAMMETDQTDPLWVMYHAVKNYKNIQVSCEGQRLSEPFIRLPNKRIYPDYYEEIRKPMSFLKIQKKIKVGRYKSIDMLCEDMELMFRNAMQYNIEESKIYKDAVKLMQVMHAKKKEVLTGERDDILESEFNKATSGLPGLPKGRRSDGSEERRKPGRKPMAPEELAKKRAQGLYKTFMEYQVDGRNIINLFVQLPSKKDYPDYYMVIADPIDMTMINQRIESGKYTTEQHAIGDFMKMLNNARLYNEEGSQIYNDAILLERILKSKVRNYGQAVGNDPLSPKMGGTTKSSKRQLNYASPLDQKLNEIYDSIKDHCDPRGRMLSAPFIKLPSKQDYPDYYEIIRKPIDMSTIHMKIVSSKYQTLEDIVADFVQMFDNACKYNEPDSLIYKDALTLQRVCLEKKQELSADDENNLPDVKSQVQELMVNLFISTYNHTDEEGRCLSDSFSEMPQQKKDPSDDSIDIADKKPPTLEQVKRNLDRWRYRRLDRFQEDMFDVFEYARAVSRSDSQLYEDAVELQLFFIQKRDELCKKGEILCSPALSYMEGHLLQATEVEKKDKMAKEAQYDEEMKEKSEEEDKKEEKSGEEDSFIFNNMTFSIGDFVYIEPRESTCEPHIVAIEKLWKDEKDGEPWLRGNWFLRPNETYHVATKKFLEKEVFKSDFCDSVPFTKVLGKCFVMSVKEYFKYKPEGIDDKDVFVCESRYSGRHKAFKKIKIWPVPKNESITILLREQPLVPVRVASVFAEHNEDQVDISTDVMDKKREMVLVGNLNNDDGCKYYEQYDTPHGFLKLGDCVYVKADELDKPLICRIDKMWTDPNGEGYIHGPYYIFPSEVEHQPTRMFYVREVFKSSIEDTNHISAIAGRCVVMPHKDYVACRITEVPEEHVYICDAKYVEAEKQIKRFTKPASMIRNNNLSISVCDDEIFFFKKPITPKKITYAEIRHLETRDDFIKQKPKEPSPLLMRSANYTPEDSNMSMDLDETSQMSSNTDMFEGSVGGDSQGGSTNTPTSSKKKPAVKNKNKVRPASGYILYAAEFRKAIQNQHPDVGFGEISRIVGQRWRDLPKEQKTLYEERAKKIADEQAAKQEEADRAFNLSLQKYPPAASPGPESRGNTIPLQNYQQGYTQQAVNGQQQMVPQQGTLPNMGPPPPPPRAPSPMFVAVPPRTQRLLHSEAYLRYIENLKPDCPSVSNWEKQLTASQENTLVPNNAKLPVHWLANGAGHHDTTTSALWALRDLMLKDTLTVSRTLDWAEL